MRCCWGRVEGASGESMNARECLKAIEAILMRFEARERPGNASRTDRETSSEGVGPGDPTGGASARPEGHGDGDDASRRHSQAVKAFIARTRPQARRATRSGRR